ncbi:GntR family transcriptional regulator [Jatrophihabitans fulvus]
MPVTPAAPRNLTRAAFARIRGDILAGRYPPGARLSPRALAAEEAVSMSVVREALTRLAEQGLVVAAPQQGFTVVKLDMDDVRDLSALRVLIEGEALRQAVVHADVEYEARVLASHHRLTRTPTSSPDGERVMSDEWAAAHAQFHAALVSAAPSARLRDLAESLRETAELYRRWSGMARGELGRRDVAGEHRALMQAALDRDAARAVALLTDHIDTTTRLLEAYVEEHRPDLVS